MWYEFLILINADCVGLQNLFRQQYSKVSNIREQLFHAWRSFHFDKNTEMIDAYVYHIRQVATLLGFGEPQILELFKNTLPTRLYWVLFPLDNLRLAVEMTKRILKKEKIDIQLAGQSSSTLFMNIQEEHNKRVTFDMTDSLEQKVVQLMVMMGNLVTKDDRQNRQFKLQVHQSNSGRGQTRHNYDQRGFQDRFRSDSSNSNTFRGRPRYGQEYRGSSRYDLNFRRNHRNNMRDS